MESLNLNGPVMREVLVVIDPDFLVNILWKYSKMIALQIVAQMKQRSWIVLDQNFVDTV